MLYLKKIVKFNVPRDKSGDFVICRETLELISGEYILDIYETGPISAIIMDNPENEPRLRTVTRQDEAYIVNESGITLRVINGPVKQPMKPESNTSIGLGSDGEITVVNSATTETYIRKQESV